MNSKYLYTIKWTQPYATSYQRPYLRGLQEQMEQVIERILEESQYAEANTIIKRIMAL
jgi:hypothetical protein